MRASWAERSRALSTHQLPVAPGRAPGSTAAAPTSIPQPACAPLPPQLPSPSAILCCAQESRGKFDLKEPYYRQQMQWMMQMAAAAPAGAAAPTDAPAAVTGAVDTPAVEAAAVVGVPQLMEGV